MCLQSKYYVNFRQSLQNELESHRELDLIKTNATLIARHKTIFPGNPDNFDDL